MKIILFLALSVPVLITACAKSESISTGEYDEFAKCLTNENTIMYGTDWCPHCRNQKSMFGDSFRLITFIDCDKNRQECLSNNIEAYPTWKIEGNLHVGELTLQELSEITGCELK